MAVNPMDMMKIGQRLKLFQEQHPKFPAFLAQVKENALMPGSIMEMKVTTPEGREYITNIRLTQDDVETLRMAGQFKN